MSKTAPCNDCCKNCFEDDKDYYMVRKELWNSVAIDAKFLCISCLENRLKRKVTGNDFPNHIPVNRDNYFVANLWYNFDSYSMQLFKSGVRLKYRRLKALIQKGLPKEELVKELKMLGFHRTT